MNKSLRVVKGILILILLIGSAGAFAQELLRGQGYMEPPAEIKEIVLAPRHKNVTLNNLSPDRSLFLNSVDDGLIPVSKLAEPYNNIGGIEIDTAANRHRRFTTGGSAGYELFAWEREQTRTIRTPDYARVSNAKWSPDGSKIAYLAHYQDETHIYVADVSNRRSGRITPGPVLSTLTTPVEWSGDSKHVTTILVPIDRGSKPRPTPEGKVLVRLTDEGENRLRTYQDLLEGTYEKALLEYYGNGQLAKINVETKEVKEIGKPGLYSGISMAPDGEYLRVTSILKPFSNIVPVSLFADVEEVRNIEGDVMAEIKSRDVRDGRDTDDDNDEPEKRDVRWRPDGLGISFIQKEAPEKEEENNDDLQEQAADQKEQETDQEDEEEKKFMDQVFQWLPPFREDDKRVIFESEKEIRNLDYSEDCRTLFITERKGGKEHLYAVYLEEPEKKFTIYKYETDEFYENPGSLMTTGGELGERIVRISRDENFVYLSGVQYHKEWEENAPRPFIDKVEIRTGEKFRVFESPEDVYERVLAVLDDDMEQIVTSRETPVSIPDSYLRDTREGSIRKLTDNVDHSPQITNAQYDMFEVKRSDGIKFNVRTILPQDYEEGEKLPVMFWFYPREYEDQDGIDEARRRYNINSFRFIGVRSMQLLLTRGYGVVLPDFPITGPMDKVNDNFVPSIQRNWHAIIDACDQRGFIDRNRLALGGHSYGAFGTAHSMIHTPYFKAGIAGAGNYNRTLTPITFQREDRILWESRESYITMSPILWAERIDGALLMYHGADDTNVGTWPVNSKRMFHALNGLDKTAALYFYPYEGHGQSGRETLLDMWARWSEWLDVHVKYADKEQED